MKLNKALNLTSTKGGTTQKPEVTMSKDYHAEGQHDREESRSDDWVDLFVGGGGSPHYDPPSDPEKREEYQAGWDNA
jgi:hypothetical protein